ncbi:MAG TPA: hypothetical protein VJ761_01275 [Ktedonobacteraceae bacterium]|nr:hypothetical protein [Ktedonobacteraceae bacterium]
MIVHLMGELVELDLKGARDVSEADRLYWSRAFQGGYVPGTTDGSMPVGSALVFI